MSLKVIHKLPRKIIKSQREPFSIHTSMHPPSQFIHIPLVLLTNTGSDTQSIWDKGEEGTMYRSDAKD